ncbi:transcription elongation factor [Stetteria hydrogenophila]
MVPQRRGDKIVLVCTNPSCGYVKEATEEELKELKVVAKPSSTAKLKTTGTVIEAKKLKVSKEELEQAKEEYYEMVLDQIGEYGE